MIGLSKDEVKLCPYDSEWAQHYEKEKVILEKVLEGIALDIQHVGSTSIIGLSAKPIIDIAVAVKDEEVMKSTIDILAKAGYDVKDSIAEKGEVLARKGSPDCRTHYIHVEVIGTKKWVNHILFRDYLRKYPEYVQQYQDIKEKLSTQFANDRKVYTKSKNDFIEKVMILAKEEFGVK